MKSGIGTRLILAVAVVITLTIGAMAVVIVQAHRTELIAGLTRSVDQLSDTVKSSTYYDMMENRRESLHRQIEYIGRQEGIDRIRIFNKEGRVMFSSDPSEIGTVVDKDAEACYACHAVDRPLERLPIQARSRIFSSGGGERVLGMINPIQNEPACSSAACHAHTPDQPLLGVLDVTVSLAATDAEIAASRKRLALLATLVIATSSLILWWLNRRLVVRPVMALAAGTRRVADGDLTTQIPITASHELGDLARAFNEMTKKVSEAQGQITQAQKLASLGRLAAGIAHEINNPLTGVLSHASFLLKRAEPGTEVHADLEVVVRETERCRVILRRLLDFARPTPPRRVPTDLNDVARHAISIVMNQLELSHVDVSLDLGKELPPVAADPNQIQQVLVNLLLNAADSLGESGGRIVVGSRLVSLPPLGNARIRRAVCPRGCDLIDTETRIRGLPSIRVNLRREGHIATLRLDPIYGSFGHLAAERWEEGVEGEFSCPSCGLSLTVPDARCGRCGSPVFGVRDPDEGMVIWCSRSGCHRVRWDAREARADERVVEIFIEDDGSGISPENAAHLFEPFFSTKGPRGTGLGLAVSWGIVDSHGGTILVSSRSAEGVVGNGGHGPAVATGSEALTGSRFTIRLPLTGNRDDQSNNSPAAVGAVSAGAKGVSPEKPS